MGTFREGSLELIKKDIRLQRTLGIISGILIGTGVGGWVARGMSPATAIAFVFPGSIFALEGVKVVQERQRYEKFRESVLHQIDEFSSAHK